MEVEPLPLPGAFLIKPVRHGDSRGFFSETFRAQTLLDAGIGVHWVQDNHAKSPAPGTLRGLHFQTGEHAQAKLVRVPRGAVVDVIVDIRTGSPTFGQHLVVPLSEENWLQLYVPVGFAHGYCTLLPDTEVQYKVSTYYHPESERGLVWNDPDLAIDWHLPAGGPLIAERDKAFPRLRDLGSYFEYPGATS
ncbi:MAG: dTDP-4-dehydrorhamnose 3,5-epimerase [Polyangiaceae bacterium]